VEVAEVRWDVLFMIRELGVLSESFRKPLGNHSGRADVFRLGAHGSPAVGYKILYANWRFRLFRHFHGCYILGGELILKLHLQLICIHVSDVEAEVAVLRPVSGFSAMSAGVGSGLSLPGCVYVHRDGIAW